MTWDLLLLGEVVTTDLPGGDVGTAAGLYSVLSCLVADLLGCGNFPAAPRPTATLTAS